MATFTEIASGLDKAISTANIKRAAVEAAKKALDEAEAAQAAAIGAVRSLHAEYQKLVAEVLTLGGQLHK